MLKTFDIQAFADPRHHHHDDAVDRRKLGYQTFLTSILQSSVRPQLNFNNFTNSSNKHIEIANFD